jgi:hypothetical protein
MELRALSARATNSERRLINAQNQLLAAEEKIATMNEKNMSADTKWEARVKEYEARLKAAEERVKRERQGSKERVGELENSLKSVYFFCFCIWGSALTVTCFTLLTGVCNDSWSLHRKGTSNLRKL